LLLFVEKKPLNQSVLDDLEFGSGANFIKLYLA
jgi:hypothetical protein